jgi:hypothetical protein
MCLSSQNRIPIGHITPDATKEHKFRTRTSEYTEVFPVLRMSAPDAASSLARTIPSPLNAAYDL